MVESPIQKRPPGLRIQLPRALLLWWSLWLLLSWGQAFILRHSIAPTSASYATSLRYMLVSIGFGLGIVWPMLRLSLSPAGRARKRSLVDWLALAGTLQVVLWPTRLTTQWSVRRVLMADVLICSWALVIAAFIALGMLDRSVRNRVLWMLVILVLSVGGPMLWLVLSPFRGPGASDELLYWSPISAMWYIGKTSGAPGGSTEIIRAGLVAASGVLLWIGVFLKPNPPDSRG